MGEEGEVSAQPAVAVPAEGGTSAQEHAMAVDPVPAVAADGGETAGGRVPAEVRKTWWFRPLIGFFVVSDLLIVGTAVRYFLKGNVQGWVTGGRQLMSNSLPSGSFIATA